MRQTLIIGFFDLLIVLQAFGQVKSKHVDNYTNDIYRFNVKIPDTWRLYGQIKNDTVKHKAIVDWGLPSIYSEIEKTNIENSISITAYHRTDISSLEQLIKFEYLRVNPTKTDLQIDKSNSNARLIYSTSNGLKYQGKSYYVYRNEIGYVITFMATPGTYNKNIKVFEDFYNNIQFK